MADTNFERLKNATVDEFALWLTKLLREAQKQAYEAVDKRLRDYIIIPDESQFKEWEEIAFNFYKNWLESEAE